MKEKVATENGYTTITNFTSLIIFMTIMST